MKSVWVDIHRRSVGDAERKEDTSVVLEWPKAIKVTAATFNPSKNIIPVQPMSPPMGKLFYFK